MIFGVLPTALLLAGACKAPPAAPDDLDPLVAFVFEHHLDDDPAALSDGLDNLRDWFERDFSPDKNKGFELLVPLTQATVDALDPSVTYTHPATKSTRATLDMAGAAAGTVGAHTVAQYTHALTAQDQDVVFPKTFTAWQRQWRQCDGVQFAAMDCELAEATEDMSLSFALGLKSDGSSYNQYRWVELPDGQLAMSHRNWQIYPPEVNNKLLEVEDQYYLNLFVPGTDGERVFRFQATWAVFGDGVPRSAGLKLTADSMFNSSKELDSWLDDNVVTSE